MTLAEKSMLYSSALTRLSGRACVVNMEVDKRGFYITGVYIGPVLGKCSILANELTEPTFEDIESWVHEWLVEGSNNIVQMRKEGGR